MKIIIKDNAQLTEILQDSKVFDLIYKIANGDDKVYNDITNNLLDNLSDFEGSIKVDYIYKHVYDYLKYHYYPKLNISYDDFYIYITDPEIKRVLLENGFGDSYGVLSTSLLSKTSLPNMGWFNNTDIQTFNELGQFTNIKTLSRSIFYHSSIKSIDLSNIEYIGDQAFEYGDLTDAELDLRKCTYFGWQSFRGCKMKKIHFNENPDLYTNHNTFTDCTNLEEITGLSQVTKINDAFRGCSNLKELNLPNLETYANNLLNLTNCERIYAPKLIIKETQSSFFNNNKKLSDLTIDFNSLTAIPQTCFSNCSSLTSIDLLNTTTIINNGAFSYCTSLENIGNCKPITIGKQVFQGCTALTSIDLSECTSSINDRCFYECTSLTTVVNMSNVTTIGSQAFSGCTSLTTLGNTSNITSIGNQAFQNCTALTSIDLSECTSSIKDRCFYGCTSLTTVVNISNVTTIESQAFSGCTSLTTLGNTSNITSIGNQAFQNCTALTSIDLSNCASIGNNAFNGCTSLINIIIRNTTPPTVGTTIFNNCTALQYIYVPAESVETYKAASGWSNYANKIYAIS